MRPAKDWLMAAESAKTCEPVMMNIRYIKSVAPPVLYERRPIQNPHILQCMNNFEDPGQRLQNPPAPRCDPAD